MVQKGLERLVGFQHGDGGWGWWSSDRTNLWMTAYVVYALGLAKDAAARDVDVVAYCRGPYCVMADDAVRLRRRRGRRARRLTDGFPEWRDAGLPVETQNDNP